MLTKAGSKFAVVQIPMDIVVGVDHELKIDRPELNRNNSQELVDRVLALHLGGQ